MTPQSLHAIESESKSGIEYVPVPAHLLYEIYNGEILRRYLILLHQSQGKGTLHTNAAKLSRLFESRWRNTKEWLHRLTDYDLIEVEIEPGFFTKNNEVPVTIRFMEGIEE